MAQIHFGSGSQPFVVTGPLSLIKPSASLTQESAGDLTGSLKFTVSLWLLVPLGNSRYLAMQDVLLFPAEPMNVLQGVKIT